MKLYTVCIFLVLFLVKTYSQSTDPCAQYPTCKECIEHNPCGWCAEPIVYQDGSRGPYCAGKPSNPDKPPPGYKPWTCPKDFQNTACFGYICEKDHYTCISAGVPNGGVPLAECQASCFPPTYDCNATTHKCYQVTPGHGSDLPSCEARCSQTTTGQSTGHTTGQTTGTTGTTGGNKGYTCDPTTLTCKEPGSAAKTDCESTCGKPANVTPVFALGNYRGLEVSHGFLKGEWQAKITADAIVIVDPTGKKWAQGVLRQYQNELWLVTGQGTRRGLYGIQNLPEVTVLTWGMGDLSGPLPTSFDTAMSKGTTFVFAKCLNENNCKWHIFSALNRLKLLQEAFWKRSVLADPLNDPCSVYPDCHSCISAPEFCGWCSVNVIYNNSVIGKNCAGINKTISPRINCTGTFSTQDCSHATTASSTTATTGQTTGGPPADDKYACDPVTNTCKKTDNGTLPKDVCSAQCVLTPIVPPDLQNKYFRGLEIDLMYVQGEWRVHFGTTDATIVDPSGTVTTATVTSIAQFLTLNLSGGTKIQTIWQLQNGPSTGFFSWAWGKSNSAPPKNFDEAMTTSGEKEFFYVNCLPGASSDVCDFSK